MKYIFSDINDTIKPESGEMSDYTQMTLKDLKEKDVELILVTGKNRQKTEEFASGYGGSRYIITSNGGELFDTLTRKVIYTAVIQQKAIEHMFEFAKKYSLRFILNIDADFRYTTKVKYTDGSEKLIESIDTIFSENKVVGGVISDIPDSMLSMVKQEIFSTDGIVLANQCVNKGNNVIDFISEYANKGVAIKKLIKHLKINYEDTISIGNERNDISMFSATCYNVAVGNAPEEIRDMVDIVIDEVHNDGVAKYLNKIYRG